MSEQSVVAIIVASLVALPQLVGHTLTFRATRRNGKQLEQLSSDTKQLTNINGSIDEIIKQATKEAYRVGFEQGKEHYWRSVGAIGEGEKIAR